MFIVRNKSCANLRKIVFLNNFIKKVPFCDQFLPDLGLLKKFFNLNLNIMALVNAFVIRVLSLHLVLLNHAPSSTQLHPPSPSSTQLHPVHFNLHLALCNTLNVIRTKISHVIGQFPQI